MGHLSLTAQSATMRQIKRDVNAAVELISHMCTILWHKPVIRVIG